MSDHVDNQNLWSPSQKLSNDVSYVGLSENFPISTSLRFEIWDGIFHMSMSDLVYIQSLWSPSQ